MRRMNLVAAAVAVAGLAVIGVLVLRPTSAPPPQPPAQTATAPPAAPAPAAQPPATATPSQPAPAPQPASTATTVPATLPAALGYEYADVDTTKAEPQTCLIFSEPLDASGQTDYAAYLSLSPQAKVSLKVDGRRLCITGLAFGTQYKATLKAGMPAASGAKLPVERTAELSLADRAPLVAFREGLILPRESLAGVPIVTVNVSRVHVVLYRVPDRLVSQIKPDQLAQRQAYPYELNQIKEDKASKVWEGNLTVTGPRNASVTTLFPISQAVPQRKPGIYVLTAENQADRKKKRAASGSGDEDEGGDDDGDYHPVPVQWVIDTDIGLTTFRGADGLHVFARALGSALPMAGLTITLVARDNDELGRAVTDAEGHLRFDPGLLRGSGGATPGAVLAFGAEGDFTYEDLSRPAFDLSDRGVDGRQLPGPVDAFVYTDRGIYRPRETVHLVALLRDRLAEAIPGASLTFVVRRPDGVEFRRATVPDQAAGAHRFDLTLTETAAHGRWQVDVYVDPKGDPVGHAEFEVQDFVPQRLKVELSASAPAIEAGKPVPVAIAARFLYGAPGADLRGEAEASLTADPAPFANFHGWRFGLVEEKFKDLSVPLEVEDTDAEGHSTVTGVISADKVPDTTLPLRASVRVSIFEPGGRSTDTRIALPMRTKPLFIGVRTGFRGGRIEEDTEASFEVAAVDADGKPVAQEGLRYELVREYSEYSWYRSNNQYRYERTTYDVPVTEGALPVAADKPGSFKYRLPWGYYRFTVRDKASGAATSVRFSSGWRGDLAEDRPDKGEVSADKESYRPGETAKLAIRPPTAGEGLLVIANDRVLATRLVHVPAEGTTVDIPVTADWGTGAYAILASYKPLKGGPERAPTRAIGLAWLPIDPAPRTLGAQLGVPDKVLPRQTVSIPVTVANAETGEKVFLTLAAVDEGILQLTRFESPDPTGFYFGKRRLAVDIRDDYGRLISGEGQVGAIRQGGDNIGGAALPVVPTRTVALFSGFVEVDAQGHASAPLEIPDFEGELRLMAVVFDRHKVGHAEGHLTVRDPVVSDVVLPRFLAPDDKARLSLSLHNLDGKPGEYRASFKTEGPVSFAAAPERTVTLAAGERQLLAFPIAASDLGIGTFSLHLSGPDGFAVDRQWQITVRSPQDPISRSTVLTVAQGKDVEFGADLLAGYLPGSVSASVSLATWRSIPVAGLLRSLDRYPYGCIEQTTSRAFPLLYFNDLALLTHDKGDPDVRDRVQGAVNRVLDMQRAEGNFGFWGPSYAAYDWLSVYALDFLHSARTAGYSVSDDALQRGDQWLRSIVQQQGRASTVRYDNQPRILTSVRDYAAYVLARNGSASVADLRYLYDTSSVLQWRAFPEGQLAAALALSGDVSRSRAGFAAVEKLILGPVRGPWRVFYDDDYYGSTLRDWAGLVRVAAEAKETALVNRLFQRFDSLGALPDDMTTQEKAWLVLAQHALAEHRAPVKAAVNGEAVAAAGDPVILTPDQATIRKGYKVENRGDKELFATVTVDGTPSEPLPAESKGVTIERKFFTTDGKEVDLAHVKQNDRIIVRLTGSVTAEGHHEMVVRDLLPAGFEIEGSIPAEGDLPYDWLPKQRYTRMHESRDDRFVAAFVVDGNMSYRWWSSDERELDENFEIDYIVRAITPGTYVLPAAAIEDMYRPSVRARTAMGSTTVETK
ncbi:MAG TPA: alpha-2-macroglobulin [Stellaceae bacterium]|nr:alpha-2-macroglobulin [Stellaceae bacterium]